MTPGELALQQAIRELDRRVQALELLLSEATPDQKQKYRGRLRSLEGGAMLLEMKRGLKKERV